MALVDCVINEKCYSVDGGEGILPSFFVPTLGDLTAQESPPPVIFHPRQKKKANARGSAREGGGWGAGCAQVELTDA